MTYIYAYTNSKTDLDRIRRMAVLYKILAEEGIEVHMLTNEFRASSMVRDLGVPACTTIQTILDIDLIAQMGDTVIIDSPEDDTGKMEFYSELFAKVILISDKQNDYSNVSSISIDPLVDPLFMDSTKEQKVDKKLLFFSDADPKKEILDNQSKFADLGLELLLGEFFYPSYDEQLSEAFGVQHESDSYGELMTSYDVIVTASRQSAYEAAASGAYTIYLQRGLLAHEEMTIMKSMNIAVMDFDTLERLPMLLDEKRTYCAPDTSLKYYGKIKDKIINIIRM